MSSLSMLRSSFSSSSSSFPAVAIPPPLVREEDQQQHHQQSRLQNHHRSMLTVPLEPDDNTLLIPTTDINYTNDDFLFEFDDDILFYDLYESPCLMKASNDEFTLEQYQEFSLLCNETFYSGCNYNYNNETQIAEAGNNDPSFNNIVNWTIVFDYEIYYPNTNSDDIPTNDPIPAIQHLEILILEHLAEITGLNRCDNNDEDGTASTGMIQDEEETTLSMARTGVSATKTGAGKVGLYYHKDGDDYRRRRQEEEYIHDFTDTELDHMIAISSTPSDVLDPDYSYCMVPVPSSISATSHCMPVTGMIRLYLNNSDDFIVQQTRLSIESGFQRLIRFGMQRGLYVSGDVKHVSFIGTRIVGPSFNHNNPGDRDGPNYVEGEGEDDPNVNDNNSSTRIIQSDHRAGIIIGAVGAVIFFILIWTLLAVRKRRRSVVAAASNHGGNDTALSTSQPGNAGDDTDEENPYLGKIPVEKQGDNNETVSKDAAGENNLGIPTMAMTSSMDDNNNDKVGVEDVDDGVLKVFSDPSDDEASMNGSWVATDDSNLSPSSGSPLAEHQDVDPSSVTSETGASK